MIPSLPSRGLRGYAGGVLAGGVSAALFTFAMMHAETMFVVIVYLAVMPLLTAGFGAGISSAVTASIVGIVGICLIKQLDLRFFYAASFAIIYALPALALVALALRRHEDADGKIIWFPEGKLLTVITLYPCVIFLAAVLITASHDGGLLAITKQTLAAAAEPLKAQVDADTFKMFTAALDPMARILPAIFGCGWIFVMLLSAAGAQSSLKQQGWNLRPNFVFQELFIPNWLIFATAATGLVGTFAPAPYNYIGTNLCAMLCIPFLLVGFAVIHALADMTQAKTLVLIAFYLTLSIITLNPIIMTWAIILITGLGVIDQWINIRQRFVAGWKKGG